MRISDKIRLILKMSYPDIERHCFDSKDFDFYVSRYSSNLCSSYVEEKIERTNNIHDRECLVCSYVTMSLDNRYNKNSKLYKKLEELMKEEFG